MYDREIPFQALQGASHDDHAGKAGTGEYNNLFARGSIMSFQVLIE